MRSPLTAPPRRLVTAAGIAAVLLCQAIVNGQPAVGSEWQRLDEKGEAQYLAGDLTGALASAQAAVAAATSPRESGRSLDRLGFFAYTSGNLVDGEKYLRQSLQLRESVFGIDSLDYAETANDLALLMRDLRRMDEATTLAAQAVANRQHVLGADHLAVAESLNTLGTVYGMSGEYSKGVSTFEQAMAIHEALPESARVNGEYGTLCVNLAGTYQRLGKYGAADATFNKGLTALRISPGPGHPAYSTSLLGYGALKVDLGAYVDAERIYEEGERLFKAQLGDEHPLYAALLNNRGFMYQSIGNLRAAEADYRRALELNKARFGPASLPVANTLRNLARLTYLQDRDSGERLLADAAELYGKTPNAPSFDYASILLGLGRAQRDRGALVEARATVEQVIAVAGKGLGVRHPLYAAAVRDRGLVSLALGDYGQAERQLHEALGMAQDVHGPDHPDLAVFLDALAGFYDSRGNPAAALPLYRRAFELEDRFLSEILQIGAENVKAASAATLAERIPLLIAFQKRAGAAVPEARALAFEAVTRRKGRVLEQVRNWRDRVRARGTDDIRRQLTEWQSMLECRTSFTVALGYRDLKPGVVGACGLDGTDLEGRYERTLSDLRSRWNDDLARQVLRAIAELKDRGDALEAALNRATGMAVAPGRVRLDDIRSRLNADELLIEYVSFDNPGGKGNERHHYGAFVLDAAGRLDWTDLGAATLVDAAVADLLAAANDWSISVRNREARAARTLEETAQGAIDELTKRVWAPLEPILGQYPHARRLRIAPDAALNLVPFEALSDGQPLLERYAIAYVPAGRDLAMSEAGAAPRGAPPIIVVSPGAGAGRRPAPEASTPAFRTEDLVHLQEAEGEARDFRRLVPAAVVFASARATELNVKGLHGPAVLHIVGHGLVRGDEECHGPACLAAGLDPASRAMALSAIVLEEAYGRGGGSPDDGILTPSELQNIDLRGTEMLVLSQCQMASGLPSVGEGIYGMRRAAALAGAKSFVAPLWNIDDRVERRLMAAFYRELAAGQSRADALRQAKRRLRRVAATSSFLFWAPVILSGDNAALPAALFRK